MLIYPILGVLAIGVVMLALNPLFAWINTALNGFLASLGTSNIVIHGMVLGGMMSVDMGGPFNKAAYVFGTAAGSGFLRLSMREAGASSSQAAGPHPSRQKFFAQRNFCEKGRVRDRTLPKRALLACILRRRKPGQGRPTWGIARACAWRRAATASRTSS